MPALPRLGLARVRGASMEPTLRDGDVLLVRYDARPRPGCLAVVDLPPDTSGAPRPVGVKRITSRAPGAPGGGPGWWLERDNPRAGVDSWTFGAVPDEAVRAVVLCRRPRRPAALRNLLRGPVLTRVRPSRVLPLRGPGWAPWAVYRRLVRRWLS